ncbi:uncharacterized protein LOC124358896 [Homalodisca vitripennis]|uniref:uncharacterized protein LOC124358896 n=1 Tax=Homalodisca vitripennis TaxID=197043 RepID=UPI001EEBE32B|nr:uncharacterized protein LOC124358896 [Homalodisca vitripennis]
MSNCKVCNHPLGKRLKVSCADCTQDFHGSCVRLSKADIEYLASENIVWRCEPCAVTRRSSLRLESQATEGNLSLQDVIKAIEDLKSEYKNSLNDLNVSYELLNSKIDDNTEAVKQNNKKVDDYLKLIDTLAPENSKLKDRVSILENKFDEMEQYSRKNCVEIHGIPETDNDVMDHVKSVGQAHGMEITDQMIDNCHLLRKRPGSDRPPGIIIKFVRKIDAENMLQKRKGKKLSTRHLGMQSDIPVYINESLSPARRRLLAMAREVKLQKHYKWLWVRGGKIFLRKEDNGPVSTVTCQADLVKL